MSSLSSVLGGFTHVVACNFQDMWSHYQANRSAFPWISANWERWLYGGYVADSSIIDRMGMRSEEGFTTVSRIVSQRVLLQISVYAGDLEDRIKQWVKLIGQQSTHIRQSGGRSKENTSSQTYPALQG
jgi:hypothetical protein